MLVLLTTLIACAPRGETDTGLPPFSCDDAPAACVVDWVEIPASTAAIGAPPGVGPPAEQPAHPVTVAAFSLARHEVTTAAYRGYLDWLDENGHPNACRYDDTVFGCVHCEYGAEGEDCAAALGAAPTCQVEPDGPADQSCDDHPATGVTWYGCRSYCEAIGGRLPSEVEWERAARGTPPREGAGALFPWGEACPSSFDSDPLLRDCVDSRWTAETALANCLEPFCSDGFSEAAPVAALTGDRSTEDVLGLGGNVGEWVEDCWHWSWDGAPETASAWTSTCSARGRVVRGGSWFHGADALRVTQRAPILPAESSAALGCRCAR